MMKLSLMKTFFDSVTTEGHSPIANDIASKWLPGDVVVIVYRASANFIFTVKTSMNQYFLRFNHASERDVEAIEAELKYVHHLLSQGINTAAPVLSTSGNFIESITTEMGDFHAVLFRSLIGSDLEFDSINESQFLYWGQAMGKMHAASKGFKTDNRPLWADHICFAEKMIPKPENSACSELRSVKERLKKLPISNDNYGLIHFDFEQDNLKWDEDQVGILDLDDCAVYWFEADIAFALRDLFDDSIEKINFQDQRFSAFLKGYRLENQISDATVNRIPLFLRMHNLVTYAKLIRTIEDGTIKDEPEWTTNLRNRLKDKCLEYREQFQHFPIQNFLGLTN